MKNIVIFYSVSGQTEYVGRRVAEELGCEYLKIDTEKEIKSNIVSRYVQGGKAMMSASQTQLKPYDFNAKDYDNIIIGFPNWVSNCPPAMSKFLEENSFAGKKVFLYTTYMARGGSKCLENTSNKINNGVVSGSCKFSLPKGKNEDKFTEEIKQLLKQWQL